MAQFWPWKYSIKYIYLYLFLSFTLSYSLSSLPSNWPALLWWSETSLCSFPPAVNSSHCLGPSIQINYIRHILYILYTGNLHYRHQWLEFLCYTNVNVKETRKYVPNILLFFLHDIANVNM